MVYKPEQRSQLQPLHDYISCHRSEPLSLQHLLCCWQLQSSNFSSCPDTISISSEVHSLPEGHETWCLCSTAWRLLAKPYWVSSHACHCRTSRGYVYHQFFTSILMWALFFCQPGKSNEWAILIHVYSTAIRNRYSISRHLQSSQGAGYQESPGKWTDPLTTWHPSSLSLRNWIFPFTNIVAPFQPRVRKVEMWSRRATPLLFLQGQQDLSLPGTVVVAKAWKASLKEIQQHPTDLFGKDLWQNQAKHRLQKSISCFIFQWAALLCSLIA